MSKKRKRSEIVIDPAWDSEFPGFTKPFDKELPTCNCTSCQTKDHHPFPANIDMKQHGKPTGVDHAYWVSSEAASHAATPFGLACSYDVYRLGGTFSTTVHPIPAWDISNREPGNSMDKFQNFEANGILSYPAGFCSYEDLWVDRLGQFMARSLNQLTEYYRKLVTLTQPKETIWKKQCCIIVGSRDAVKSGEIRFHVYISRLLFECVADESTFALLRLMIPNHEDGSLLYDMLPVRACKASIPRFTSSRIASSPMDGRSEAFSMNCLLDFAESTGYSQRSESQVPGLNVQLIDFQAETVQWMLDQEGFDFNGLGLNGFSWIACRWIESKEPFYASPMVGDIRLQKPSRITGGLLCEQMGMGKTVETLALILLNPRMEGKDPADATKEKVRASLIIVPEALITQWNEQISDLVPNFKTLVLSPESWKSIQAGLGKSKSTTDFLREQCRKSDLVLLSLPLLGNPKKHYSRPLIQALTSVHWHRIVIDECQNFRLPTSALNKMLALLSSTHRWMVSGTPFPSGNLDDLFGLLQFLDIWPFSLKNDGYWEKRVRQLWKHKDTSVLPFLHRLIEILMIRHTTLQQRLSDKTPLLQIPSYNLQYLAVTVSSDEEPTRLVYKHSENALRRAASAVRAAGFQEQQTALLRKFANLLFSACNHLKLLSLNQLDFMLRFCNAMEYHAMFLHIEGQVPTARTSGGGFDDVQMLEPEKILAILSDPNIRKSGANYDTQRTYAMQVQNVDKYERMNDEELLEEIKVRGMEVPAGSNRKRKDMIDTLLVLDSAKLEIHETGFRALLHCMKAKESHESSLAELKCNICLCDVEEPTFSKCTHVCCKQCFIRAFETIHRVDLDHKQSAKGVKAIKCPICRRPVLFKDLMCVKLPSADQTEDQKPEQKPEKSDSLSQPIWEQVQVELEQPVADVVPSELYARYPAVPAHLFRHIIRGQKQTSCPKFEVIINDIKSAPALDRFVIFSHHHHTLQLLENALTLAGFARGMDFAYLGHIHDDEHYGSFRILLGVLDKTAAGLNLPFCNVVYMIEPCFQKDMERQAIARLHRLGQTRHVRAVVLYLEDSVESRLLFYRDANRQADQQTTGEYFESGLTGLKPIQIQELLCL